MDFNGLVADGVAELMFARRLVDAFVVSYRRIVDFVDLRFEAELGQSLLASSLFCLRGRGCDAKD